MVTPRILLAVLGFSALTAVTATASLIPPYGPDPALGVAAIVFGCLTLLTSTMGVPR